jgi:AraC-like DNA-binding protein
VANEIFDHFNEEELTDGKVQMTQRTHPDTLRQQVWYWAAEYYNQHQQYKKASTYGLKALPLCEAGNDRTTEGDCLTIIAIALHRQGDFQGAIGYAKRCNELDRQAGDPGNIASSLNLLAAIFTASYQHEEAEQCINEGLKYAEKAGDKGRQAVLNGMACEIYYYMKDYRRSLEYGSKALQMEQELGRDEKVAMRQSQMAGALIGMQRMDEARQLLEQALPVLRNGNPHSYAIACNQMGDILLHDGRDGEAAASFQQALQVLVSQSDLYNEGHSRRGLYQSLRKSHPAQAMEHIDRYMLLRDSIYSIRTGALLSQYAALSGNLRLQAEKAELERQHRNSIMIGIAVFLAVVALLWLFARYRIRREQRRIAELTQQIARLTPSPKDESEGEGNEDNGVSKDSEGKQETVEDKESAEGRQDHEFLLKLVNVVNQLLPQGLLSVERVADEMNLSSATLRRRLLQATGEAPKAYFTAIQMQKATSLLTSSDLSVADVARHCGFMEVSNFIRAFKRVYGVSPSQYLKR